MIPPNLNTEGGAEGSVLARVGRMFRPMLLAVILSAGVVLEDDTDDGVSRVAVFDHKTTGTPANGIGAGIALRAPSAAGTLRNAGAFDAFHTDVTDGAEVSAVVVRVGMAGALREVCRFVADDAAVNGAEVYAANAGDPVIVRARGSDTNVSLLVAGKGTGGVALVASDLSQRVTVNNTGIGLFGQAPVAQGAHIPDVSGGSVVDVEMRAAFNAMLALWRARGDIASS